MILVGCAGATGSHAAADTLRIERPEPTDAPASIAPVASDAPPAPVRAWARQGGVLLAMDHVAQLSVHDRHLCFVGDDGHAWCLRSEGVLRGSTLDSDALARQLAPVPLERPVREVAAGSTHACAIDGDGAAWCWGTNDQGELGDGSNVAHVEPVRVSGLENVVQIAAGERFTCARTMNDETYCWGRNDVGQLGDGTRVARSGPVHVLAIPPAADLAAGRQHACVRTHEGRAWCWGDNSHRQLGCSPSTEPACNAPNEPRPIEVPGGAHVRHLALGDMHTCARRTDESVSCWGERTNSAGQTGYGREAWPEGWFAEQVAAGGNASCAVMDDSRVRCWGDFAFDPFDRGEEPRRSYLLPDIRGAQHVEVGDRITCIRFGDGAARCWIR
jgi:alpha-tubulin suppressor-like RCC1 family protein